METKAPATSLTFNNSSDNLNLLNFKRSKHLHLRFMIRNLKYYSNLQLDRRCNHFNLFIFPFYVYDHPAAIQIFHHIQLVKVPLPRLHPFFSFGFYPYRN